jgi:hypothetical protein
MAIAAIPLARAPLRLLVAPTIMVAAGAVAAGAGVVAGGPAGATLVAAGIVVAALAVYLGLMLLTVRLDVEVATLRLHWLGGGRRYMLARGAVTRVTLRGEGAARLRPRFGALGWAIGRATLRGEERVEVIRLARTASVILVPTDRGRLAVAPRSESQLIEALTAAARVQQRLDAVATQARSIPVAAVPAMAVPEMPEPEAPAVEEPERGQRLLTGIERTLLEERLAAERAAALAAAEAERRAAAEAAAQAAVAVPTMEPEAPPAPARERHPRLPAVRLPALRRRAGAPPEAAAGEAAEARQAGPGRARRTLSFVVRTAAVSLPLLAAGAIAAVAAASGRLDLPEVEMRPAALALALAGPLGAMAALLARTWFPRLAWLVAGTSLLVLVLVGRALLG